MTLRREVSPQTSHDEQERSVESSLDLPPQNQNTSGTRGTNARQSTPEQLIDHSPVEPQNLISKNSDSSTNRASVEAMTDSDVDESDDNPPTLQCDDCSSSSSDRNSTNSKQGLVHSNNRLEVDPLEHRRTLIEIPSTPPSAWLEKFQLFRYRCGMLVNHRHIQVLIVGLIAINALMMGIGTFDFVQNNPQVSYAFEVTDMVFLIIFTIELTMQFIYQGWRLITDGWLVFDLLVIVVSWSFDGFQIIRAFRVLRALRLITRVRVMQNLVIALFGVVPRMFAIGMLLMLISYIFAVMLTELFQDAFVDGITEENYFGNIFVSFFTLFQYMTMDDWASSVRELAVEYPWAWLPVVVFIIITAFVVVNLIIAVICDAVSALHEDDKAKLHGTFESDDEQDSQDRSSSSRLCLRKDLHTQLDALEENVNELTRMQEETMHALQTLARSILEAKQQRQRKLRRRKSSLSSRKHGDSTPSTVRRKSSESLSSSSTTASDLKRVDIQSDH